MSSNDDLPPWDKEQREDFPKQPHRFSYRYEVLDLMNALIEAYDRGVRECVIGLSDSDSARGLLMASNEPYAIMVLPSFDRAESKRYSLLAEMGDKSDSSTVH